MIVTTPDGRQGFVASHHVEGDTLRVRIVADVPAASWLVDTGIEVGPDGIVGAGMSAADFEAAITAAVDAQPGAIPAGE